MADPMTARGHKSGMTERVRYAVLQRPGQHSRDYAETLGEDLRAVQKILCVMRRKGLAYRTGPAMHVNDSRWYPVHTRDTHPLAMAWWSR